MRCVHLFYINLVVRILLKEREVMYNDDENDFQYRYSGNDIPYNNGMSNNDMNDNTMNNNGINNNQAFSGTSYQYVNQNNNTKKKSKGFFKRAVCFVLAAVLFGVIAGSVMFGVNYAGGKIVGSRQPDATNVDIPTVSSNIANVSMSGITEDTNLSSSSRMDVEAVAAAALPAMVELNGTTKVSGSNYFGYGQTYEATSSGTGIIVGKSETELLIVTNAHVVDSIDNLKCVFSDGTSATCSVKGSKSDQDIAVAAVLLSDISSDTASSIAIAELEDSTDIKVGQQVVAIGNALGEGQSVTTGIISAKDRSITVNNVTFNGLIMTDAAINSGNSGGALLNSEGKVIAINFAKTSSDGVEGMAYSIPVSNVKDIIDSLMTKQTRSKVSADKAAYLGIAAVDITSNYASYYGYPVGILIRTVADNSAADKAGLETYDIIVGFDDQTVTTMSGLTNMLQYYEAGEKVTIDYYHMEGSEYVLKSTEITLGSKKQS